MINAMLRALVRMDRSSRRRVRGPIARRVHADPGDLVIACIGILSQIGDLIRTDWVELAASMFP